jgi:uroporphyrinogen-III synthase
MSPACWIAPRAFGPRATICACPSEASRPSRSPAFAESETSAELGAFLLAEGVSGRRVAVQHHGSGADGLDELFSDAGADVVSLTVYRWGPPADPA